MSSELITSGKSPIDPFSYAYMTSVGESHEVRLARAIYTRWAEMPAVINDTDLIFFPRSVADFLVHPPA